MYVIYSEAPAIVVLVRWFRDQRQTTSFQN